MLSAYIGRFAPSPTGPLHFGSLVTAVGSYLQARCQGGQWRVRIEDLDPPREIPGAADLILRTLEAYGMPWDGEVWYQSRRQAHYREALERLRREGYAYDCGCSRKELLASAPRGAEGPIYPGTCREGIPPDKVARAVRLRTHNEVIGFKDPLQGTIRQQIESEIGDFIVLRSDGLFAYQLAVVIDDEAQGITEVVRGADLLDSTIRQIYLQQILGLHTPGYIHLPVATDAQGNKLSKQSFARPITTDNAAQHLLQALAFLNQRPPTELLHAGLDHVWAWALAHWRLEQVPHVRSIHYVGD